MDGDNAYEFGQIFRNPFMLVGKLCAQRNWLVVIGDIGVVNIVFLASCYSE